MALVVVLILTWSTVASTARFGDYSGAKMPQYETGDHDDNDVESLPEDYHGHSPDASLSLDYKYEEDVKYGKTESLDKPRKVEAWRNPKNRRRNKVVEPLDDHDEDVEYDPDIVHRRNQKHSQRKSRLNNRLSRNYRKENNINPRRSRIHEREKSIKESTDSDDYMNLDKEDTRPNKRKEFDDDEDERYHETTERIIKRKQRDKPRMRYFNDDPKEDLKPDRRVIGLDYPPVNDERRRRPVGSHFLEDRYRPVVDEDEPPLESKRKMKVYDEDEDYYDMKRVESIKNKLPALLRRTSLKTTESTSSTTNIIDILWTYRRADAPPATSTSPGTTITSTARTLTTTPKLKGNTTVSNNSSQELSLAEKSRLSILKKAQRKESLKSGTKMNKPPVLLQVAVPMPTMIMVEPPNSENSIVPRAREISEDTPERLNRAKLLMRKKLIGRAKSIQDLTDNWDEVICDYIDVALLDGAVYKYLNSIVAVLPFIQIIMGAVI